MEEDRLKLLAIAKKVLGLPIVTEVMNLCGIDLVAKYVDVIQEFLMSAKYNHSEHGTRTGRQPPQRSRYHSHRIAIAGRRG